MKNKTRKKAILSLLAAMTLTCGTAVATAGYSPNFTWPEFVTAEESQVSGAAKIGDVEYTTFAEALEATKTMTGNVTMGIYEKVTLNTSLSGSYDSITFVGKTADAEIYLDVQGYITATGKKVSFTDLTLSKSAGGFIGNAGFMNVAFGVYDVVSVTYTNCYFANGAYASSGNVTFEGCTFKRSNDKYGLWAYGDVTTTVNNCTFDDYRGIKMYAEGAAKTVDLTVTNTKFSAVTDKPAIVLTYGESVTLAGNTYSDTGVFELDLDGSPNGTTVTSTDPITCMNDNGDCGVMVDGKIYKTVADAAAVANSGSVVTLLHNTTEDVTLPAGVSFDNNGYTAANVDALTGETDENGNPLTAIPSFTAVAKIGYNYYATLKEAFVALQAGGTLTLMNDATITEDWDCRNYGGTADYGRFTVPVTIDGNNHTLKFTGKINDGGNWYSVFRFEAAATVKNLTIDMSEAISVFQNRFSAISTKAGLAVEKCTFIGSTTYTKARAIIYGEGATTGSLNVFVDNCNFINWNYGVTDEMGGKDTAQSVTITNSTFDNSKAQLSVADKVTFNNNTVKDAVLNVKSYTNDAGLKVEAKDNTLEGDCAVQIDAEDSNINANIPAYAKMGSLYYMTVEELLAAITVANAENTYKLSDNVTLIGGALELPAGATFNGNGKTLTGTLTANGDLTFEGKTTVTTFSAGFYDRTFTIGADASLNIVGSSRLSVGWGNTFNIVGTIAQGTAKSADASALTPSLYVKEGLTIVGTGTNFNVTNALVKFDKYSSSKNSSASGTFNINVTNSIWEQTGSFVFSAPNPGFDPTFNFNLKDSVFNSTSHVVFAATNSNVVFDNSNVNVGNSQQLENRGTLTIKNNSVVHAANAESQNAGMPGTTIVDNATYVGTGTFTGAIVKDNSIGTLIVKNNATVELKGMEKTNVYLYTNDNSTLKIGDVEITEKDQEKNYKLTTFYLMSAYNFSLTVNKDALKANESLSLTVSIDKAFYSAEYTLTYDKDNFVCSADTDGDGKLFVTGLYKGEAGELATYNLVAKNEIASVDNFGFTVTGNVLQYADQALNDIANVITGDEVSVKVSLNYTAEVKLDYVNGYSLVLVKGDSEEYGYAYDGAKMFYVEAYEAYAILVAGEVDAATIDEKLSKSKDCETISQSYNVNAEYVTDGLVDLKDATAVYACSIKDFANVAAYMELYLRADVNGDYKVNVIDVNEVVKNYTK